jgi:hypothetical protein
MIFIYKQNITLSFLVITFDISQSTCQTVTNPHPFIAHLVERPCEKNFKKISFIIEECPEEILIKVVSLAETLSLSVMFENLPVLDGCFCHSDNVSLCTDSLVLNVTFNNFSVISWQSYIDG